MKITLSRVRPGRLLAGAATLPLTLLALTACGPISGHGTIAVEGTAGPAGISTTTATGGSSGSGSSSGPSGAAGSPGSGSGSSSGSSGGTGCAPGGTVIPKGAGTAKVADLDGDGRGDTIWLDDVGSQRTLGVRTASGAGFTTVFSSAAPQSAVALAGRVQGDPVILLDTGRSVSLYTVSDCRIVATQNPQGGQYTFDKGFTGYGTGVGCPTLSGVRRLVGYLAKPDASGKTFTVTRTVIDLSEAGTHAANSSTTTLASGASAGSATVKTAQSVTCGSSGVAAEPQ